MDYTPVSSSNVAAIGYDDASSTLGVQFLDGSEYHYYGVPRDLYDGLMGAQSKGGFLSQFIKKGGFKYSRIQ